jgi:hypothetical protein
MARKRFVKCKGFVTRKGFVNHKDSESAKDFGTLGSRVTKKRRRRFRGKRVGEPAPPSAVPAFSKACPSPGVGVGVEGFGVGLEI